MPFIVQQTKRFYVFFKQKTKAFHFQQRAASANSYIFLPFPIENNIFQQELENRKAGNCKTLQNPEVLQGKIRSGNSIQEMIKNALFYPISLPL
jgi:hypothetical protein